MSINEQKKLTSIRLTDNDKNTLRFAFGSVQGALNHLLDALKSKTIVQKLDDVRQEIADTVDREF